MHLERRIKIDKEIMHQPALLLAGKSLCPLLQNRLEFRGLVNQMECLFLSEIQVRNVSGLFTYFTEYLQNRRLPIR